MSTDTQVELSLYEQIQNRLQSLMRAETATNRIERDVLRVVIGEVENLRNRKENIGKAIPDDMVDKVIRKIIAANDETLSHHKLSVENRLLNSLVPKMWDEQTARENMVGIINDLVAAKGDGPAVGLAMKHLRGQPVAGDLVAKVVKKIREDFRGSGN